MTEFHEPVGEILLYQTPDGQTRVECRFADETLWLSQALIAELFDKDVRTVNEHLLNIFDEGELDREATIRRFRMVRQEGDRQVAREIEHYSLEAILAVGYRVRSPRGTQFRIWATERLREYLIKGFVMDDERLKNPPVDGIGVPDYFDELLERIRDVIRGRVLPLGVDDMSASAGRVWNSIRGYEPAPIDAWHSADMSMGSLLERREDQAHLLHQQSACQDSGSRAFSARPWRCTSGAAAGSEG